MLRAFWWAPRRSARLLKPEIQSSSVAWLKLLLKERRTLYNFGDEITPLLLTELTGEKVKWSAPPKADVIAVGSIIELYAHYAKGARVWGSGLRDMPSPRARQQIGSALGDILAVRGPLTGAALGCEQDTPLGDPGVLAVDLLQTDRLTSASGPLVIPHYRVWQKTAGRSLVREFESLHFKVLSPSATPTTVVDAIATCEYLLTSSLHATIFAHSLGIPVVLTNFGEAPSGERPFKYEDYFLSVGGTPTWVSAKDLLNPRTLGLEIARLRPGVAQLRSASHALKAPIVEALTSGLT